MADLAPTTVQTRPDQSDTELAEYLVRTAGDLAARMRTAGLTVDQKTSISDVVSDADKAAEAMIVAELAHSRPADGLLGEEGASAPGDRTWVIDPVDGTFNFVSNLPAWCSALALVDDEVPLLGAIYQPNTDEMWIGGVDHPTTLNGVPIPQLVDRPLHELAISTYLSPERLHEPELRESLLRAITGSASIRIIGSGSIELAAVASGRLGVWLHADTLPWDWMPGRAIIEAAGGVTEVFEHGGHRWHVAGPPTAVAQAKQTVVGAG
ncbi:inositol monophosphatase family protein [Nakamurella flava]|uniref:Inositol monophosphatase family protein n=1 Tax=Nakamurella flava TaxID=2576308 RepID=A0A4U6QK45_9ACTN|nr:inositol monophosphatase family protein [Nakamurella flava]TKV60823.1 inositol monophosphatase family protein [Nakamurella flava]